MATMVDCICEYCNEVFQKELGEYNRTKHHFCSRECVEKFRASKNSWLRKRIKVKCANCGKELDRVPHDVKRSKYLYCNKQCMIEHRKKNGFYKGENNGNYKGGKVEVECAFCGKKVIKSRWVYNAYKDKNIKGRFFCNRECADKGKTKFKTLRRDSRIELQCDYCKRMFKAYASQRRREYKFCSVECRMKYFVEDKASAWKGGVHSLQGLIRNSEEYRDWRFAVYARDDFKCTECGETDNLNAHHIKRLATIIEENNITTIEEAMECAEIWDIDNGTSLCLKHHAIIHIGDRIGGRLKIA